MAYYQRRAEERQAEEQRAALRRAEEQRAEEQRAAVDLDSSLPVLCDTTHCVEPEPELIVDVQGHNNRGRRGNKAKGTVSKPTADPSLIAGSLRQAYLGEIGDAPLVLQVLKTSENNQPFRLD